MPIHIIFDGPPSHESGRFVEVEDDNGKSICIGEWNHTPGKLWELVIPDYKAERDALAAENARLREALEKMLHEADWGPGDSNGDPNACFVAALAALSPQPPTASPSAPAECPACGGSGRVSLLADDDGGMTTRPCACQSLPAPEDVSGDSELERRIQKLEQMVDGIRCWTEQHDAALEEEDSHE